MKRWGWWAAVAAGIAALDVTLARRKAPLLSHVWWDAVENPSSRWFPLGVWAALTYHLHRPRRRWREAIAVGAAVAIATRKDTRGTR